MDSDRVLKMYIPFPIYDFKSGLRLDKEPFLLPADAFTVFQNVYIDKGCLVKRKGIESLSLNIDEPVLGIKILRDIANNVYNIIFGKQKIFCLDLFNSRITEISSMLNGRDDSYVIADEWKFYLFCSNQIDRPFYVWNNGAEWLNVDFDNDGQNDIERCLACMQFKGRLLLFSPMEKGTFCPQRIRWSKVNLPFDWTNDDFLDIPTSEIIVSAQRLEDKIIIWCSNSVWELLYTANYELPFVVRCIAREIKTYSSFSGVKANNQIFNVTETGIVATDSINVERIDYNIYDFNLFQNLEKKQLIFGYHCKKLHQVWWSFVSKEASEKDKILYYDYLNKNWGILNLNINIIGDAIKKENAKTWDEIEQTWDEIEQTWDETTSGLEEDVIILGDKSGKIYKGLNGYSDDTNDITMELETIEVNPFTVEGKKARLGWIDILVDSVDTSIVVDFFIDYNTIPFLSREVNLNGEGKKWIRVQCGVTAEFHKIRIRNTSKKEVKIYAIIYYFKPVKSRTR